MADLTRFTERSPLVLAEAKDLLDNPLGELVGSSSTQETNFYVLGSFDSPTMSRTLYAGLKTRPKDEDYSGGFSRNQNAYFILSLSNLILLDEICPQLSGLMPTFFGAVRWKLMIIDGLKQVVFQKDF
jgi:hypothetical protein